MLAFVMASMLVVSDTPAPLVEAPKHKGPTLHCREMGSAASRSQAIKICRSKAQWQRAETCQGATRYCAPNKKDASLGRETAFAMNEDSRVVCRIVKQTGTRLRSSSMCMPNREWDRMWQESSEGTRKLQDFSKRVEGPQ